MSFYLQICLTAGPSSPAASRATRYSVPLRHNFVYNSVMLLAAPQAGDTIEANCSSHNSVPAAVLHWYVNGEEATGSMVTEYPVVADSTGLRTSVLGLRYANTPPHPSVLNPILLSGDK